MEAIEKKLVSAFSESWNATAPALFGSTATLKLLSMREVSGDGVKAALAVATTWSSSFAATCSGALSGIIICLFKADDLGEIERLVKGESDGNPKPGSRALVNTTLENVAAALSDEAPAAFNPTTFIDLAVNESRLSQMVGDAAIVGTYMLNVGDDLETQALLLYAPHGAIEAGASTASQAPVAEKALAPPPPPPANNPQNAAPANQPNVSRRNSVQRRDEPVARNIERLLDVELDVIVRFGVSNMPLRDVVRMGIGTMIELNRAIDEPVELLINGRHLARGEVVVVDGYYGVRITEIGAPAERALSIL